MRWKTKAPEKTPSPPPDPGRQKELARRRRERVIIVVALVLVGVVSWVESRVVELGEGLGLGLGSSIVVFALININALLLLLLIFLVFRNLVKLMMERRQGLLGAGLKSKLVGAFVVLSLGPTVLLFLATFQVVGTSMDYWFSAQVERSLFEALEVVEGYNSQLAGAAEHFAELAAAEIKRRWTVARKGGRRLEQLLERIRARYDLGAIILFSDQLKRLGYSTRSGRHISHLKALPLEMVGSAISTGLPVTHLQPAPTGDFAAAIQPLKIRGRVVGAVVAVKFLPAQALARARQVRKGLEGYRQLEAFKGPIKTNLYITLSIVTLLIIFGGTWFGFHLARAITEPLMELARGTQRVAEGDYDFSIQTRGPEEIIALVNAFNRMIADLRTSKARLQEAQRQMRQSNLELEQRRRYMETVLNNIAAGVIAIDAQGRISAMNPSAGHLLKLEPAQVLGRSCQELMEGPYGGVLRPLLTAALATGAGAVHRQVQIAAGGEWLSLMLHASRLRDDRGRDLGTVIVFEDLTELEKAQRMAAWREVARRIAHEVKNPLTPIKLSAQRLMRRYGQSLGGDEEIFNQCITTIIRQVEELKRLVDEFGTFARLPAARLVPARIAEIAAEAVELFRGAHPGVRFELELEGELPPMRLDKEQMKRVFINLLDNAVAALEEVDQPKEVVVRISYDGFLKIVRIEVEDTGPGVAPEAKLRLFEPYFSTKKGGTGLGLTIVSTIISDHGGYIRAQDNHPRGTRIIIELPVRGLTPEGPGQWQATS